MKRVAFIALSLMLVRCSAEQTPESNTYVLSEDSLALMLVEVHFRNAVTQHKHIKGKPSEALAWNDYERVFDSLGVSQERFDSSLNFYLSIPGAMEPVYDDALSVLSTRLAEAGPVKEDSTGTPIGSREELEELMKTHPSVMTTPAMRKARARKEPPSPPKTDRPSAKQLPRSE